MSPGPFRSPARDEVGPAQAAGDGAGGSRGAATRRPRLTRRRRYFTRLSTSSTTPPPDPAGLLHFISSPATVMVRVCSAPVQFGNVLFSTLILKVLPSTE